ncbi:hypothetical protein PHSY_005380 [Pseudozyma hubeiensis SY62]|uniref:Uncharacterized protein n=1 Tax=Pseudozyma hubeiensis (strain SY62) TaxID=1305764 RepID=R9P8U0_PSEHS|nr:hypothetical protein PHSY_005380 [Pseudozyma hubeiensis SY62]GAC97793.1 hypothetical protein PHSY_005380 [Pseudozyma hubeiensis SY62]
MHTGMMPATASSLRLYISWALPCSFGLRNHRKLRRRIAKFVFCNFAAAPRNFDHLLSSPRRVIGDGASEAQLRLHSLSPLGSAAGNTLRLCVCVPFGCTFGSSAL